MDDYRIRVGFLDHPKTCDLIDAVGDFGVVALLRLFEFCTMNPDRSDGNLSGLSDRNIERVCRWSGEPGLLARMLKECGWIDGSDACFSLHDWQVHNPYVATHKKRRRRATSGAKARWKRPAKTDGLCLNDKQALLKEQSSNAKSDNEQCSITITTTTTNPITTTNPTENPKGVLGPQEIEQLGTRRGWRPFSASTGAKVAALGPMSLDEFNEAADYTDANATTPGFGFFASVVDGQRKRAASRKQTSGKHIDQPGYWEEVERIEKEWGAGNG